MAKVIRGFAAQGIVAIYSEPSTDGDELDFNAPRNAPAKSPQSYLDLISFHSDFTQYELAFPVINQTINHPSVGVVTKHLGTNALTGGGLINGGVAYAVGITVVGNIQASYDTLYTHGLGYRPKCLVIYNDRVISTGTIVQVSGDTGRYIAPYVDNNVVGIKSSGISGASALPAISVPYKVLIFREQVKDPSKPLFQKIGNQLLIGRGMIDTTQKYLRKTLPGDQSFSLDLGPTIDIANGKARTVSGGSYVTESGYNGSFTGSPFVPVGLSS